MSNTSSVFFTLRNVKVRRQESKGTTTMSVVILIVDDEPDLRDFWQMTIEGDVEAQFLLAANGAEAIRILSESNVDIIVSDYNMPHKNGGELFLYNKDSKNLPFILISGGFIEDYPEFKYFKEANSGNRYFLKPVDCNELVGQIKKIIEVAA